MKKTPVTVETATSARDAADFHIVNGKAEPRVDSRLIAQQLGIQHKNALELLKKHRADFEQLGKVAFQTEPLPSGQTERLALLNEDQSYLLLTFSRNTAKVRALKVRLVKAFSEARKAAAMRQEDYLPAYHELHDAIDAVAAESKNRKWIHVNANRALNKFAGIRAGTRRNAGPLTQSLLAIGCTVAANAVLEADDQRGVQERIKAALLPIQSALMLGGAA